MYRPLRSTRATAPSICARCALYEAPGLACGIEGPSVIRFRRTRRVEGSRLRSSVMIQVRAEIVESPPQPLLQVYTRLPAERGADRPIVGIIIADVDPLAVGGKLPQGELAAPIHLDQQLRQVDEAHHLHSP